MCVKHTLVFFFFIFTLKVFGHEIIIEQYIIIIFHIVRGDSRRLARPPWCTPIFLLFYIPTASRYTIETSRVRSSADEVIGQRRVEKALVVSTKL